VVAAEDRFCEECGRDLRVERTPVGGPEDRDRVVVALPGVAGISDRGRVRQRNEDSMAFGVTPDRGLAAVVCDGVASSDRSERASQAAADTAAAVLFDALVEQGDPVRATTDAVAAAYNAVSRLSHPDTEQSAPSCTFVSAVVRETRATIGWLGDSRAYWVAGERSRRLTEDDTWAAQLVADGVLTEEQAKTDSRGHVLSRWVGADAGLLVPQVVVHDADEPGVLLLCSDGLWNYLPEPEHVAAVVPVGAPPQDVVERLVAVALEWGGHDNVTVVAIPLSPA
jgi:serine/threonine protein phosphatase PrpC